MSSNVKFAAYYGKGGTPVQVTSHKPWGRSPTCSLMRGRKTILTSTDIRSLSSSTSLRAQGTSHEQNCSVNTWAMAEEVLFPILKIHQLFSGVIPPRCAFPKLGGLSYMKFTLLKCLVWGFLRHVLHD